MRTPMPSPHGTNRAGLYLPEGSRAAVAYDASPSAGGMALTLEQSEIETLLAFLEDRLDDGDMGEVRRMLAVDIDDRPAPSAEDRRRRRRVGASDAARREPEPVRYDTARFPHSGRLK